MQHQQPPPPSIETLESSIHHLVTDYQRRQRWQLLLKYLCCYHPQQQQQLNNQTKLSLWRTKLTSFLELPAVHLTTIVLLLLDLSLTVIDLSSSILSCSSNVSHENKKKDVTHKVCHWGGVAILSLLTVKMIVWVLGLGVQFFRRPGHVVDALVVVGALVLEVVAEGKGAGLVVVVSLWRVVRVVESAFELSNEAIEAQIESIEVQFEELREENRKLDRALHEKDAIILELEMELNEFKTC
ncbi:Voltage-dependent channel domain-containing protein [Dioscorea alata]|uniref:Voltage-dependent channel domain-containing protein n=1 Tax=Dioscorea alata TaxID=55571 RepID=A0ACB7VAH6_DIOAL|nr:Voltage-dependent channel domain-containing protein [Dioscorea alata]